METAVPDWNRIWSVFHRVRETPPERRAEELAALCAGDVALRRTVDELLAADGVKVSPLDSPAGLSSGNGESLPNPGDTIGVFRIVRAIGEGGMGMVYEAEQESPVRRRVALKMLRSEISSPAEQARFEAEHQALAMMAHSHIARVYDGGTAKGHPYFAMEFVEGLSITQWCDRERLSLRERIELFIPACEAVQHAHQRGVIHRDLKPSNVLVTVEDGRAIPKVIDFGVAKGFGVRLSDRTLQTVAGTLLGTPSYMSPEQASLNTPIDTRSDVYSLGVMLYELATGKLPFEIPGGDLLSALERIRNDEPLTPSRRLAVLESEEAKRVSHDRGTEPGTLVRATRGDLQWIVMKALEKSPDRRYGSAGELAADLRRFLANEPVLAGPPSGAYRFQKLVRRHRALVIGTAAVVATLLVGVVATGWMAIVASEQRDSAESARDQARKEASVATATTKFVQQMIAAPDPFGTERVGPDIKVIDVLDKARQQLSSLEKEPQVEATIRHTVAKTYMNLGKLDDAIPLLRQSVTHHRRAFGVDHPATLRAQSDLSDALERRGDYKEAEQLAGRTLAAQQRILGRGHEDSVDTLIHLALAKYRLAEYDASERLLVDALEGHRRVQGPDHAKSLVMANNLAQIFSKQGKKDEAEKLHRDSLARRRRLFGDSHPSTMSAMNNLATLLVGRVTTRDEALTLFRETTRLQEKLFGPDHYKTQGSRNNVAVTLYTMKRFAEAEKGYAEVVESCRRSGSLDQPRGLSAQNNLAVLLRDTGRPREAEAMYRRLMPIAERVLPENEADLALFRIGYARTLAALGRFREGEKFLDRAHQSFLKSFGPNDPRTKMAATRLAAIRAGKVPT